MRSRKVDGPEIRRVREARGLSVPDLVEVISGHEVTVSMSMICKIENGDREPSAALFAAMWRALGVTAESLLMPAEAGVA